MPDPYSGATIRTDAARYARAQAVHRNNNVSGQPAVTGPIDPPHRAKPKLSKVNVEPQDSRDFVWMYESLSSQFRSLQCGQFSEMDAGSRALQCAVADDDCGLHFGAGYIVRT
jgi:hypothetical protein